MLKHRELSSELRDDLGEWDWVGGGGCVYKRAEYGVKADQCLDSDDDCTNLDA